MDYFDYFDYDHDTFQLANISDISHTLDESDLFVSQYSSLLNQSTIELQKFIPVDKQQCGTLFCESDPIDELNTNSYYNELDSFGFSKGPNDYFNQTHTKNVQQPNNEIDEVLSSFENLTQYQNEKLFKATKQQYKSDNDCYQKKMGQNSSPKVKDSHNIFKICQTQPQNQPQNQPHNLCQNKNMVNICCDYYIHEVSKAKVGRKFHPSASQDGFEKYIYIKRSIFRINKKFWGKKFQSYQNGNFQREFNKLIANFDPDFQKEIQDRINEFSRCKSRMAIQCKPIKRVYHKEKEYFPLVGDPCYMYNRLTKERFLKNKSCAFLFLISQNYIEEQLFQQKKFDLEQSKESIYELTNMAKFTLNSDEKLCDSLSLFIVQNFQQN